MNRLQFDQNEPSGQIQATRVRPEQAAPQPVGPKAPPPSQRFGAAAAPAPAAPRSLAETGLSLGFVADLILKTLHMQRSTLGIELAHQLCLPFTVIDEVLEFLKETKCVEVVSGEVVGRVSYRFELTDLGRDRARYALEQCRYVGPAPVALSDYARQATCQAVTGTTCDSRQLEEAFSDLVIPAGLVEELGPAVCSGKSVFVYGPPGNGKTVIARGLGRFLNEWGGNIYVPYSFLTENSVITVFDPSVHQTVDDAERRRTAKAGAEMSVSEVLLADDDKADRRWRRIRRPVVVTGGELTLNMLDLRYNSSSNFYQAPLHIKANGGVFLIDDFGRQIVTPRDLLNRWILPLEERRDHLTLATGAKFEVPFEQLIIFSTNLEPRDLVDEAFLRRIRHKVQIDSPTRGHYTAIFQLVCNRYGLRYLPDAVEYLYQTYYDEGRLPRASDPRDLLEIVLAICRFRHEQPQLSIDNVAEAANRFFYQL